MLSIIITIVISASWFVAGFFWGKLHEMKYGLYRKAYYRAMKGWQDMEQTLAIGMIKIIQSKNSDGSVLSPFQIKKK